MGWLEKCQLCGSPFLRILLDMGSQPLAERFDEDRVYPLQLRECLECELVQLGYQVSPDELFPPKHPYATGNTMALRLHYQRLAGELSPRLAGGDVVVEIGANDGTLLREFPAITTRVAVEPTDQISKCDELVVRVPAYFSRQVAERIVTLCGKAKLVVANNVLAHVPDVHDAIAGIAYLLADDGVLVSENHDVHSVRTGQFDTVYHEHLRYYSPATFARLLSAHGLEVTEVRPVDTHGGSFRTYARKRRETLHEAPEVAGRLLSLLEQLTADGSEVFGVGATTRAVPLIHYADIARFISVVVEVKGSEKIGRDMPGTEIPVIDERMLFADQPAYALILSWHIVDSIIPKLKRQGYKGRFIIPLPEPRIVD